MKPPYYTNKGNLTSPGNGLMDRLTTAIRSAARLGGYGMIALLLLLTAALSASAQSVNFQAGQVRATVPILSTNTSVITNYVTITNTAGPNPVVNFSVSGLPAGVGYALTETNGTTPLLVASNSCELWLTLYTTNLTEGVYSFTLNGSGGATKSLSLILQSAHIWNGANGAVATTNNSLAADRLLWSSATNWLGGTVPGAGSEVVFADFGAQTNVYAGVPFTNSYVDTSVTVGSLRFAQTGYTNSLANNTNTPPRYHHLQLNAGVTLTLTGSEGFSLLRDTIDDFYAVGTEGNTYGTMGVNIRGAANSALVVNNSSANFAISLSAQLQPSLNMSNLATFVAQVNRFAVGEYQAYPNYNNYNEDNSYGHFPRRFAENIYLARTNVIKASFIGPDSYTNENTRQYAFSYLDSETAGVGSSVNNFFFFGATNQIYADSVCLIGANHATGNGGAIRFATNGGAAYFRGPTTNRMTIFSIGDDGGTTNRASSNVKGVVDFAILNGFVDMLVDQVYLSRDRTAIASNDNPTAESTLYFGRGIIDANTAILGYQEHDGKTDWTTLYGAQVYRGYCRGTLIVTNGGTFKVNGNLTLGYTADSNPSSSAQQWMTAGQITVYSNSTLQANNIVVDGGLNFYNGINQRDNNISLLGGTLIVTNSLGAPTNLPLDNLTLSAGTIVLQNVDPSKTNIYVRNLLSTVYASTIKILNVTGVASYPVQLPVISYLAAAPYLKADVTGLGAGYYAYVLDNTANKTIDVFITTNVPNTLIWRGLVNANWDLTTKNFVMSVGGAQTNFSQGDYVTFDDGTAVNAITVVGSVVPGQTGTGVTVNNVTRNYTFSGGTINGTSVLLKQGTGSLTINGAKNGPLDIQAGTVSGSGYFGAVTLASNAILSVSGTVSGGLTSTGTVVMAASSSLYGPVAIWGGVCTNSGYVSTAPGTLTVGGNAFVLNTAAGVIDAGGGQYDVFAGATVGNHGTINNLLGRMNLAGVYFGTGQMVDPDGGTIQNTVDGRLAMRSTRAALVSPGANIYNSIGVLTIPRIDMAESNPNNNAGTLRIEIDYGNAQTNDMLACDRWNTIYANIVMTNISGGAFSAGQVFTVFTNNNGPGYPNYVDAPGLYPLMWPMMPGPGLVWNLANIRDWGTVGVTNIPLIWNGTVDGNWETAGNFKSSMTYSDGQGVMFDDSASGPATVVTLSTVANPVGYSRTTNIISGVSTNYVTNAPAFSPALVFSNASKNYTITGPGRITGLAGLYKAGSGTLTILTTNDYTGGVFIHGGTVAITNSGGLGIPANAVATYYAAQGAFNQISLNNNGTLDYFGTVTTNLGRFVSIEANGGTLRVSDANTMFTINNLIRGEGLLTKSGPGILDLNQNGNIWTGGLLVNNGILRLSAAAAGFGGISLANGTTMELTNVFTLTNAITVASGAATITVRSNIVSSGPWSGSGAVTISNAPASIFAWTGTNSIAGFSGSISLGASSGSYRLNNTTNNNDCTGSATTAFDLGTGSATVSNLSGAGVTYNLGSLAGGANTILAGRITNAPTWPTATSIYSIGAKGGNTAFDGRIMNGNGDVVSVVKVGSGRLCLNGVNTYSGMTTVSNGIFGGNGSIAGGLTVVAPGTFEPGCSIGTFTVSGAVTLGGATVMELDRTVPAKSDKLVAAAVTAGGTLTVINIGPTLYNGSTFTLFTVGVSGFSVAPSLPAGYSWANNLALNGSITVTGGGLTNPVPPTVTSTYSGGVGGTLTMSWPYENLGWTMYTNSVSLSSLSDWHPITGSGTTNQVSVSAEPGKNVFYILRLP
jgi:autotransporter-associated beta strand protein